MKLQIQYDGYASDRDAEIEALIHWHADQVTVPEDCSAQTVALLREFAELRKAIKRLAAKS